MQQTLFEPDELNGIPSAHDPTRLFYPRPDGNKQSNKWTCDCEHFRIYRTPCRHILQKRFNNIQEMYQHISEAVKDNRDMRDFDCQDLDEVISYIGIFRTFEMNKLATLMLNIAVMKDKVSTDDLHIATNEAYRDDKIVGVVTGALLRDNLIECIGRKKTERKLAHGRSIGIYQLTKKGFDVLSSRCIVGGKQ